MPVSAATIQKLLAAGIEGEELVDVVASIDADAQLLVIRVDSQAERRRAADRERKRQKRHSAENSAELSAENPRNEGGDEIPPDPPKKHTPSPPKGGSVPKTKPSRGSRLPEDWALPEAWRDWAIAQGADVVRVHDVKAMRRVAQMTDAIYRRADSISS